MRTLDFVVKDQRLTRDRKCDFSGIVAGSSKYLRARFKFDTNAYDGCIVIASFWSKNDTEHAAYVDDSGMCTIPTDALQGDSFKVSITGYDSSRQYKIKTNRVKVKQEVY